MEFLEKPKLSPERRAIMELTMKFAASQLEGPQEPWTLERADAFFSKITKILSEPFGSESGTETTCETTGPEKGDADE